MGGQVTAPPLDPFTSNLLFTVARAEEAARGSTFGLDEVLHEAAPDLSRQPGAVRAALERLLTDGSVEGLAAGAGGALEVRGLTPSGRRLLYGDVLEHPARLYRTLQVWLPKQPGGHIFDPTRWPEPWRSHVAGATDTLLQELELAAPNRLASKRRAFRTERDNNNLLDLRVELLIAFQLARRHVPFEFGAEFPDIVCNDGVPVGIEIGCRTKDDLQLLHNALEEELAAVECVVTLYGHPLTISDDVRKSTVENAVRALTRGQRFIASPLVGLSIVGQPAEHTVPGMRVFMGESPNPSAESDVFRAVTKTAAAKRLQADRQMKRGSFSGPVVLVIDASRVGLAGRGMDATWMHQASQDLLEEAGPDYAAAIVGISSLGSLAFHGVAATRAPAAGGVGAVQHVAELLCTGVPPLP